MQKYIKPILSACIAIAIMSVGRLAYDGYKQQAVTSQSLEAYFAKDLPRFTAILKADFPDDFLLIIEANMEEIKKGGSQQAVRENITARVSDIRRKYADQVYYGPDNGFKQIIQISIDLHKAVKEKQGVLVCGSVVYAGINVLPLKDVPQYFSYLDEQGESIFRTIRIAIDNPVNREELQENDWGTIANALLEDGMSQEEFDLIAQQDSQNEKYCGVMDKFLKTLRDNDTPEGMRVRADFVRGLMKQ